MSTTEKTVLTVKTNINAPAAKVWEYWTTPEHIMQWNRASPDWHTPRAENDLREGGSFTSTMAAKDGSMSFEFGGTYDAVRPNEHIAYTMGDGRQVKVHFEEKDNQTSVIEHFDAERENPIDMQQAGWQAIMDNFKKYVESKG